MTALATAALVGLEFIASMSGGRKSGATRVSLLRRRTACAPAASAARMPALFPPA
jgi:hypothetical protein